MDSLYLWVEDPTKLFRDPSPMLVVNVEVKLTDADKSAFELEAFSIL